MDRIAMLAELDSIDWALTADEFDGPELTELLARLSSVLRSLIEGR